MARAIVGCRRGLRQTQCTTQTGSNGAKSWGFDLGNEDQETINDIWLGMAGGGSSIPEPQRTRRTTKDFLSEPLCPLWFKNFGHSPHAARFRLAKMSRAPIRILHEQLYQDDLPR